MQSTGQAGTHSSQPVHRSDHDGMHELGRADDRVNRAGLDAFGAADAVRLDDACQRAWLLDTVFRIEW